MASEQFTNLASTTVPSGGTTAPVAGTVESWTVASNAGWPTADRGIVQNNVPNQIAGSLLTAIATVAAEIIYSNSTDTVEMDSSGRSANPVVSTAMLVNNTKDMTKSDRVVMLPTDKSLMSIPNTGMTRVDKSITLMES